MKALTIFQPYPELIVLAIKLVENRDWETKYRGPLLIHSGVNRGWLRLTEDGRRDIRYDLLVEQLAFGAIVGRADVVDCVPFDAAESSAVGSKWPWLATHRHASGKYCLILQSPKRFLTPIPYVGHQKFFDVPDEVLAAAEASGNRLVDPYEWARIQKTKGTNTTDGKPL